MTQLIPLSETWLETLLRVSIVAALVFCLVWLLLRLAPTLPPRYRVWLWRLAALEVLVAFVIASPIELSRPALLTLGQGLPVVDSSAVQDRGPVAARTKAAQVAQEAPTSLETKAVATPPPWTLPAALFVSWLAGLLFAAIRLGASVWAWQRLLRSTRPPSQPLRELFEAECREIGIPERRVTLEVTHRLRSPAATGILRPRILVPEKLEQQWAADIGTAEARMALVHELVHIKRRDILWSFPGTLCRLLLFFHPFVWLLGRELRLAQEMAADEIAAKTPGSSATSYAHLLVGLASTQEVSALATSMASSKQALKERLAMLARPRRPPTPLQIAATCCGIIVPWLVPTTHLVALEAAKLDAPEQLAQRAQTFAVGVGIYSTAFTPNGLVVGVDGGLETWGLDSSKPIGGLLEQEGMVMAVDASQDGRVIVTGSLHRQSQRPGQLLLWKGLESQPVVLDDAFVGYAHSAALSPTGTLLAMASGDGGKVIDTATLDTLFDVPAFSAARFAFSADGSQLATRTRFQEVAIVSTGTGIVEQRVRLGIDDEIMQVALSPDNRLLAVAVTRRVNDAWEGETQLFDLETGERRASLAGAQGARSVAFSPDGRWLAAGYGGPVILWDPVTTESRQVLSDHHADVWGLEFSPDGSLLATASADRRVHLYTLDQ